MDGVPLIAYFGVSIPIIAIVMGIGSYWYKQWLDYKREVLRSRTFTGTDLSQAQNAAIEALRQEIMQLRDTTTQYDMTVERSLTQIRSRLDHLETKRSSSSQTNESLTIETPEPAIQRLGAGS